MPETSTIETAADALLRVVVTGERERRATAPVPPFKARPFQWRDPTTIPTRDALNVSGLVTDPIGTACRAELRRIGHAVYAAGGLAALHEAEIELAEMDPTHSGWRAIVLETAWAGIGGRLA